MINKPSNNSEIACRQHTATVWWIIIILLIGCRIAICSAELRRSAKITSSSSTAFPTSISDGAARTTIYPNGNGPWRLACLIATVCLIHCLNCRTFGTSSPWFLPERDCVTFGSLLSPIRLSSVCLSACNVGAPYSVVEAFNISSPLYTLAIPWLRAKFLEIVPIGTPLSGAINATGVAKLGSGGPNESYIP